MGGCISHRGEEGSVCVLNVSDTSVRSKAEYATIARNLICSFILGMVAKSRL